jgi:CheY-like chemotaxis protein
MEFPALRGRSILLVEDEPLIGMDIRTALENAGAHVTATDLSPCFPPVRSRVLG